LNGDTAYVLRSDGTIFRTDNYNTSAVIFKMNTSLNGRANTEGLYFDKLNRRLLIACKGEADSKEIPKYAKVVYSYDLTKNKLDDKPFLLFDQKEIEAKLNAKNYFAPSAVAVDPVTSSATINLEGLNLSDEHLEKINVPVQEPAMTELGSIEHL